MAVLVTSYGAATVRSAVCWRFALIIVAWILTRVPPFGRKIISSRKLNRRGDPAYRSTVTV
jgi:hypothetical protein